MNIERKTGRGRCRGWVAGCALGALALGAGCQFIGFGGAMVENYKRTSTHTIEAEYKKLEDKKWAVVVEADRVIQADYPELVRIMTASITTRLADKPQQTKIRAARYIPAENVIRFQYQHPSWMTLPHGELAKQLGVDRLIVVELVEYRLTEPGNQYLWDGLATGTVGVIEADGPVPDEYAFQKSINIKFPDKSSMSPNDLPASAVASELIIRFVDRASWIFYAHEEPYYPKY